MKLRAAALSLVLLPIAAPAAPAQGRAPRSLRILLTNDDGYAAPGLAAVREALTAAGHRVTVVAPLTDQSGVSAAETLRFGQPISARQQSPGVWSVAGTPADSVMFGVQVVFGAAPPDLVVSGANFGQNTGAIANHSGTVGAAVTADELGVPALAVSTELDLAAGQEATVRAFPATASYVASLVGRLAAASRGRVLPAHLVLNVNYPIGTPKGTRITRLGRTSFVVPKYVPAGPDSYVIAPDFPAVPEPVKGADTTALAADHVSVTPLDADWTLDGSAALLGLLP
ncbi:5'/3'-nucleotidase SurE [Actinocorallia longicatena]|uniref:5'-nucleotidase SurE n=1 Tax=Actinocorallia longicatena TaxID=111803 RepID=A0ABP6Q3D0_9ACTN